MTSALHHSSNCSAYFRSDLEHTEALGGRCIFLRLRPNTRLVLRNVITGSSLDLYVLHAQMDLDDLEKQWEGGDHEEELKTEQQTKFERLERRRKEAKANAGNLDPRYSS